MSRDFREAVNGLPSHKYSSVARGRSRKPTIMSASEVHEKKRRWKSVDVSAMRHGQQSGDFDWLSRNLGCKACR